MRQSRLFGKTLREDPAGEVAANARLLERAGFVYKTMAGAYDFLPLGFCALTKINAVIREEMDAIGGQELLLSAIQPKERWVKSGRWESLGAIMYQFKDHSDREIGLAPTHEEPIAEIATRSIFSYRDLPLFVYQIQTKYRDEPRAKSGLMRGREFLMKDLYSFHRDELDLNGFYEKADQAYRKIFKRLGLDFYVTEASGGTFTKEYTHEYQVLADAGEDHILYCSSCRYSQNQEITKMRMGTKCPKCSRGTVQAGKAIEVGNIFKLGTKFAKAFGLYYADERGEKKPVVMGSYGIGPGRLMATIVEVSHDERGIIWPEVSAPYRVHLMEVKSLKFKVKSFAESLYKKLLAKGVAVLYDDRDEKSAGEKFADADLIGIPWRVVVSEKTIEKKGVEIKRRSEERARIVSMAQLLKLVTSK
ncbi:MAG: aminoacyl--tRNA ligase-related protein [Patescibacteria group bacterium]